MWRQHATRALSLAHDAQPITLLGQEGNACDYGLQKTGDGSPARADAASLARRIAERSAAAARDREAARSGPRRPRGAARCDPAAPGCGGPGSARRTDSMPGRRRWRRGGWPRLRQEHRQRHPPGRVRVGRRSATRIALAGSRRRCLPTPRARCTDRTRNKGYLQAPSLAHAATAAVLRSGYLSDRREWRQRRQSLCGRSLLRSRPPRQVAAGRRPAGSAACRAARLPVRTRPARTGARPVHPSVPDAGGLERRGRSHEGVRQRPEGRAARVRGERALRATGPGDPACPGCPNAEDGTGAEAPGLPERARCDQQPGSSRPLPPPPKRRGSIEASRSSEAGSLSSKVDPANRLYRVELVEEADLEPWTTRLQQLDAGTGGGSQPGERGPGRVQCPERLLAQRILAEIARLDNRPANPGSIAAAQQIVDAHDALAKDLDRRGLEKEGTRGRAEQISRRRPCGPGAAAQSTVGAGPGVAGRQQRRGRPGAAPEVEGRSAAPAAAAAVGRDHHSVRRRGAWISGARQRRLQGARRSAAGSRRVGGCRRRYRRRRKRLPDRAGESAAVRRHPRRDRLGRDAAAGAGGRAHAAIRHRADASAARAVSGGGGSRARRPGRSTSIRCGRRRNRC